MQGHNHIAGDDFTLEYAREQRHTFRITSAGNDLKRPLVPEIAHLPLIVIPNLVSGGKRRSPRANSGQDSHGQKRKRFPHSKVPVLKA